VTSAIPARLSLFFLVLSTALALHADTQFRVRIATRTGVPVDKGQCDIRLQIEQDAEVSLRGDEVRVRPVSGPEARDLGSECNAPLPSRKLQGFHFEVAEGHGDVRLLSQPSRRNGYQAVVRIRNRPGGEGRYHLRLTWLMTDSPDFPSPDGDGSFGDRRPGDLDNRPGGLTWNNTTHLAGRGRGTSTVRGNSTQRLSDVSVDIDRSGRILVSFRTEGGRRLSFSGSVIGSEGDSIKADVATEDSLRLRGSMYLSRNPHGDVSRVSLDATDGQTHLMLDWDRH